MSRSSIIVCIIVVCVYEADHTLVSGISESQLNHDKKVTELLSTAQRIHSVEEKMDKLEETSKTVVSSPTVDAPAVNSSTNASAVPTVYGDSLNANAPAWMDSIKSGALQRTGLVVLGIMSVLLIFFVVRAVRIRQKKSKSRKYGVITSTVSDMEMEPLDRPVDDDEEETTLFDAQQKFRRTSMKESAVDTG